WTMTVAFAAEAASENSEARAFLESALEGIPVFVAPESCPRNPRLPLEDIGMLVNALYQKTLETKCPPREVDMDLARRLWASLPHQLRRNSMDAVMNLEAKMRSFNLDGGNPDAFDTLPREELALLAEVEHNRWSVVTLLSGKRPASREEQAYIEQDIRLKDEYRKQGIHYDLRAFSDLRPDAAGIPVAVYDEAMVRGIPLMVRYLKEMTE
ncbi:MAG: hypothetical protein IJ636_05910, partial [Bacteroidales bacterium]|nr:hypothetical protein [Bacteroidales bacterium]